MKVQVWNAFASNNSGSYTLVGRFPDATLAAEVAAELTRVASEHTAWLEERREKGFGKASPSPLETFMQRHGLSPAGVPGPRSSWPEYSTDNTPVVWAQGHQVLLHHSYTLGLPPAFGEFIYKRGGRVETELEHTHHPLVGVFHFWIPYYTGARSQDVPVLALRLLDTLYAEDGPLVQLTPPEPLPAWRVGEHAADGDLVVGAAFSDLVAGFTAVDRIAREQGFSVRVRVFEAWDEHGDALAFLRPCHPPLPTRELFDVVLTGAESRATLAVLGMLEELRQLDPREARALLDSAPAPVRRRLPRGVAEAMAGRLQGVGARVEVRPSEP